MKKIYVMAAFLGATSFAFNQSAIKVSALPSSEKAAVLTGKANINPVNYQSKALGTSLFFDNFDDISNWVIDNDGQGTNAGWIINDSIDGGFLPPFQSTGGGNFAEVRNQNDIDDPAGIGVTYTLTTANAIDLQGNTNVILDFEQFGAKFNDLQKYQISVDGGANWIDVGDNNYHPVLSNTGGSAYPNPENVVVNLGQHIPVGTNDILLRFLWTSRFPTDMTDAAWIMYGWVIDNVNVSTLPDNDISTNGLFFGTDGVAYHQIPEAQIAPIDFSVNVKNEGSTNQTGVKLNVTSGSYSGASAPISLAAGATADTLEVTPSFTPTVGNHVVTFDLEYDNTDDIPSNNMMNDYKFTVGGHIYARDTSTTAQSGAIRGSLSQYGLDSPDLIKHYAVGYDIVNTAELTGIDFQLGGVIKAGEEVAGQLLNGNRELVPGAETEFYTVVAGDEGSYQTLKFETPITVNPGTYYVAVQIYGDSLSVAYAGTEDATPTSATSVFKQEGQTTWGFIGDGNPVYVIRMNFDPSLSVENNTLSNLNVSQNFPNPFANETKVLFNLKEASNVSYTVVDLTGKVVANVNEGTTMAGDHEITIDGSSFANGVYYLNITAGESNVTRKMIVNK